jgi:hypothetical protein
MNAAKFVSNRCWSDELAGLRLCVTAEVLVTVANTHTSFFMKSCTFHESCLAPGIDYTALYHGRNDGSF